MTRYRARVDTTQAEIAQALRAAGWDVEYYHACGGGVFDMAVRKHDVRAWLDAKTQRGNRRGKITKAQRRFMEMVPDPKIFAVDGQDAVDQLARLYGEAK